MKFRKLLQIVSMTALIVGMAVTPVFASESESSDESKGILIQREVTTEDLGNGYTETTILEVYKPEVELYADGDQTVTAYKSYVIDKTDCGSVLILNLDATFKYNAGLKTVTLLDKSGYPLILRDDIVLNAQVGAYENSETVNSRTGVRTYKEKANFSYTFLGSGTVYKKYLYVSCDSTGKIKDGSGGSGS